MDNYFKNRIEMITEKDFWSSMKAAAGLKPALEAAKVGHRVSSGSFGKAYRLLGAYHARTLASEAEAYRESLLSAKEDPKSVADLRRRADMVLRHEIQGWHGHVIKFGTTIDFNADFGQSGQYGFHYLSWLIPVLDMYVMTGARKFRDCFINIIKQYYDQRTKLVFRIPHLHPVYYELGARAKINLLISAYATLAGNKALDSEAREAILKLLLGCGRSLYGLQETGYRSGNWQIVGCAALYRLGAAFPEFRESAKWRKRAETILTEHARKDFFADGGHGERCWGYGLMSLNGMIRFYRVALRHGLLDVRRKTYWKRFLKKCYRWYAASTTPSRHTLNYGDGGIGNAQDIFDAACRLFPEMKKERGLLGVDRTKSNILRPSGYAFMRGGDDPDDPFMSINFGRWGGGHTHADLLDFTIWKYGRPIIDEVGRFGSYDNPLEPLFRSEQSHNQIVLEHCSMNRQEHEGQGVLWHSTNEADFFSAWHEAYAQARIHRHIIFVKPFYWVIYDVITAKEYIFQVSSCLHALKSFRIIGRGKVLATGSPGCLILLANPGDVRSCETGVDYTRKEYNGVKGNFAEERYRLRIRKWRDIMDHRPITFATLLMPFKGRKAPEASITPVRLQGDKTGQAGAFRVTWNGRKDLLVFNPNGGMVRCGRRELAAPMAVRLGRKWIAMG